MFVRCEGLFVLVFGNLYYCGRIDLFYIFLYDLSSCIPSEFITQKYPRKTKTIQTISDISTTIIFDSNKVLFVDEILLTD